MAEVSERTRREQEEGRRVLEVHKARREAAQARAEQEAAAPQPVPTIHGDANEVQLSTPKVLAPVVPPTEPSDPFAPPAAPTEPPAAPNATAPTEPTKKRPRGE